MNQNSITIFLLSIVVLFTTATCSEDIKYLFFDDYLSSLNEDEQSRITGEKDSMEGSGAGEEEISPRHNLLPLRTGLTRSKDESCCALGQLAGDKGYHCVSKFYAARILLRNTNRAHNRKLDFFGTYSVPDYGTKLMGTFEQCVAHRVRLFNKCCHMAAEVRKSRPHYDSVQRKRYEMKMRRIRMPKQVQVDNLLVGV